MEGEKGKKGDGGREGGWRGTKREKGVEEDK